MIEKAISYHPFLTKPILKGAMIGILFAALIALFSSIYQEDHPLLQLTLNFFCSLPVFLMGFFNLSGVSQAILFFGYWALVAGVIGWLTGFKSIWLSGCFQPL